VQGGLAGQAAALEVAAQQARHHQIGLQPAQAGGLDLGARAFRASRASAGPTIDSLFRSG
jgi:hypothetical protein